MAKRGRPRSKRLEISSIEEKGYCSVDVYREIIDEKYIFIDIRTTVDFSKFSLIDKCEDFTIEEIDSIERFRRYKTSKIFDTDYNYTARNKYTFKVMQDLYSVLWNVEQNVVLDSAETLVSPNRALYRAGEVLECEKRDFLYSIAIIGNFLPVPTSNQALLKGLEERFDKELNLIKAYYFLSDGKKLNNDFVPDRLAEWLKLYRRQEGGAQSWQNFVDCNFLKGSFVDEKYNVKNYDGTIRQLSQMIYNRSVVMIQEYERRVGLMDTKS